MTLPTDVYGPTAIRLAGKALTADIDIASASLEAGMESVPTLTLEIRDPDRRLVRSPIATEGVPVELAGVAFVLREVRKTGSGLTLVAWEQVAADMDALKGPEPARVQPPGAGTRGQFLRRLVDDVPGAEHVIFDGAPNTSELARGGSGSEDESSWGASGRIADEVAWRRFSDFGVIVAGPDDWLYGRFDPFTIREHDREHGIGNIDFDTAPGVAADSATVEVNMGLWTVPPGRPVKVLDLGAGSGLWLTDGFRRPSLGSTQGTVTLTRKRAELPEPQPATAAL